MNFNFPVSRSYNIFNNKYNSVKFKGSLKVSTVDTFERSVSPSCFDNDADRVRLSKKVSCLLRHTPQFYNLELDSEGWTSIDKLVDEYNKRHDTTKQITTQHLVEMSDKCNKGRFEVKDGRIRALYGHSLSEKINKPKVEPPEYLYHGTSPKYLKSIQKDGLLPRKRQYVHLAKDVDTAVINGKRKDEMPIILVINAKKASEEGKNFYIGSEQIMLSDEIPAEYIEKIITTW
ncbi:MAG: RNA 2'-phosphotransferase [Candidatus Gastranaerophilales bacterium]|nr:RNA 2'-phosphotransferase [Candidatus Gastranaerophilales bacterium]